MSRRQRVEEGHQTIIRHRESAAVDQLQEKVFTNWANFILRTKGFSIGSVSKDLSDGLMLLQLAEILIEKSIPNYNRRPIQPAQKLENLQIAINAMKTDGLNVSVDIKGIMDGDSKTVLGLFWLMIKHYQLGSGVVTPNFGASNDRQGDLERLGAELEKLSQQNACFTARGEGSIIGDSPGGVADPCKKCGDSLSEGEALTVDGEVTHHVSCFTCTKCNKTFTDEAHYYKHNNEPYCFEHYLAVAGKKCSACDKVIRDDSITMALNKPYHNACFTCTTCQNPLGGDFTLHQDKPYCKQDYYRAKGWLCGRCDQAISREKKENVKALGKMWHKICFYKCTKCGSKDLDEFYDHQGKPYCKGCADKM